LRRLWTGTGSGHQPAGRAKSRALLNLTGTGPGRLPGRPDVSGRPEGSWSEGQRKGVRETTGIEPETCVVVYKWNYHCAIKATDLSGTLEAEWIDRKADHIVLYSVGMSALTAMKTGSARMT
jgi:hypothetical protein